MDPNETTDLLTRAAAVARKMLSEELGILEGSRLIAELTFASTDPLFMPFQAIESETEEFPFGSQRDLWSEEGLRAMDAKLSSYLERNTAAAREACQELLARVAQG